MTPSDANTPENQPQVVNNAGRGQYELQTPGGTAVAVYRAVGGAVMFTHTEVPEEMEGQGIGSRLIQAALDDVQAQGRKVIPICPFVAGYIREHPAYLELVDPVQRGALGIS